MLKSKTKEEPKVKPKEEPKKKAPAKDPAGKRSIVMSNPNRNRAKIQIGDKVYKVIRHMKRRSKDTYLAVAGGKSVLESDWMAGKADVGLTDEHIHRAPPVKKK